LPAKERSWPVEERSWPVEERSLTKEEWRSAADALRRGVEYV
jgi:hypothetical protein